MKPNFKDLKILVIEDNPGHWFLIRSAIEQALPGLQAQVVQTEEQAMACINTYSVEEWELPKLILLDLYLPDRANSWRLLQQLKAMPGPGGQIPVVLLSSSDQPDDIAQAYRLGCSSYLVKPTSFQDWLVFFQTFCTYWLDTATLPV